MHVYDKAKWHHEAPQYPGDLPADQALVHIGLVLAWLIDRDLLSELFRDDFADDIERYQRGELSGPGLAKLADGALVEDMVAPRAHRFLATYYSSEGGAFWDDYEGCFVAAGLESIYHVADSAENSKTVAKVLDERLAAWEASSGGEVNGAASEGP